MTCAACGGAMAPRFERMFDDRYGYPGYFTLLECAACGHLQTVPQIPERDVPALYRDHYPRRNADPQALRRQIGEPGALGARLKRWARGTDNQGQYAARPGMTVLDYGAGGGTALLELERLGCKAFGIEADPGARELGAALGLPIHVGALDDAPFDGLGFDLIVLNQVLEHVADPALLLAKLRERLQPGGRIVLCVPNAGSAYRRRYGRAWINWHVPYHMHHFTRRSMRALLARHGWRMMRARTITPNLWTALQLAAAAQPATMGVAHPLWNGQAPAGGRRWRRRAGKAAIAALNRALDAIGMGDSLLVTIAPTARAG